MLQRWHHCREGERRGDDVVSIRGAALAGLVGAAVFAVVVVFLTLVEYGFMLRLGWNPLGSSDVPWPSGLALGPLGWLQVLNFAFFGLTLIFFALGLHRGVAPSGRLSWVGPTLLVVAGVALVLAAFKTDAHLMQGPQTWHGAIHFVAFLLLALSFLLSLFFWWRRLGRDPRWRGYAIYTLITALLYLVLLFASAWQWGFYLFLANVLIWVGLMALHLGIQAERTAPPRVR
jgi:Protein of unknown function (DUF998)